jgi:hypothetical protein
MEKIDNRLIIKGVTKSGDSLCLFPKEAHVADIEIQQLSSRGTSVIALSHVKAYKTISSNKSLGSIVVGSNRMRICVKCHKIIKKTVKVRNDCSFLGHCSSECLSSNDKYINDCGDILTWANKPVHKSYTDNFFLAVNILFSIQHLSSCSPEHYLGLQTILGLESHPKTLLPELQQFSFTLYEKIRELSPNLLQIVSNGDELVSGRDYMNKEVFYQLIRVVQYNAQPLPVPGVKNASLLCLLPTFCRLNHSCAPNATLLYGIKHNEYNTTEHLQSSSEVVVYMHSIKDIIPGEEVCISYLSQPCARLDSRRDMLSQAFHFRCTCRRCTEEEHRIVSVSSQLSDGQSRSPLRRYASLSGEVEKVIADLAAKGEEETSRSAAHRIETAAQLLLKIDELMSLCRRHNMEQSITTALVPSTAHDASLLVLQLSVMPSISSSAGGSNPSPREEYLRLSHCVRACNTLSECWSLTGWASAVSRLEVMVAGGSYCGQMIGAVKIHPDILKSQVDRDAHNNLLRQTSTYLVELVAILETVYIPVCSESGTVIDAHSSSADVDHHRLHSLVRSDMTISQVYFENLKHKAEAMLKVINGQL